MTNLDSDPMVIRTNAQAERFASKAKAAGNDTRTVDVSASTEPARVPSLSPTYSITVTVTDPGMEAVVATWSVPTESRPGTRRGVRFFGWTFPLTGGGSGRRVREPMAWAMVTR